MNPNQRITLQMSITDAIYAVSEGNPGAIRVIMEATEYGPAIDPQSALGSLGVLLALDAHGIYGPRVWMLYKDVCGQDVTRMLGVMRACQLGILPEAQMLAAIDGGERLDVDALMAAVRDRLPGFAAPDEVNVAPAAVE